MEQPTNSDIARAILWGSALPRYALSTLCRRAASEGFVEADLRQEFGVWVDYWGPRSEPFGTWQRAWNLMVAETGGYWTLTPRVCQRCHGRPYSQRDAVHGGICRDCHGTRRGQPVRVAITLAEEPVEPATDITV